MSFDPTILTGALEKAVRTGIQGSFGAGIVLILGIPLTTPLGGGLALLFTVAFTILMAYATPTRADVETKANAQDPMPKTVETLSEALESGLRVGSDALATLRTRFGAPD